MDSSDLTLVLLLHRLSLTRPGGIWPLMAGDEKALGPTEPLTGGKMAGGKQQAGTFVYRGIQIHRSTKNDARSREIASAMREAAQKHHVLGG